MSTNYKPTNIETMILLSQILKNCLSTNYELKDHLQIGFKA
jgi:hypothetical protein